MSTKCLIIVAEGSSISYFAAYDLNSFSMNLLLADQSESSVVPASFSHCNLVHFLCFRSKKRKMLVPLEGPGGGWGCVLALWLGALAVGWGLVSPNLSVCAPGSRARFCALARGAGCGIGIGFPPSFSVRTRPLGTLRSLAQPPPRGSNAVALQSMYTSIPRYYEPSIQ